MRSKNWNVSMRYLNAYEINSDFLHRDVYWTVKCGRVETPKEKIDVLFERKKGVGRIINKKLNVW